jgi:hypothetical protein
MFLKEEIMKIQIEASNELKRDLCYGSEVNCLHVVTLASAATLIMKGHLLLMLDSNELRGGSMQPVYSFTPGPISDPLNEEYDGSVDHEVWFNVDDKLRDDVETNLIKYVKKELRNPKKLYLD